MILKEVLGFNFYFFICFIGLTFFACNSPILQEKPSSDQAIKKEQEINADLFAEYEYPSLRIVDEAGKEYSKWDIKGGPNSILKSETQGDILILKFQPERENPVSFFGLFDMELKKGLFNLSEDKIPFKEPRFGGLSENGRFVLLLGSEENQNSFCVYQRNQKKLFQGKFAGKTPRWLPNHQLFFLSDLTNTEGKNEGMFWTLDGLKSTGDFFKLD